jgi:hypothetical protein
VTTIRHAEVGEYTEEQLRVQRAGEALHRDGASPAGALELLAALVEDRTWERLADAKGRSFNGRFRDFVEARSPFGLGYDPDQLPKVLALRHPHESVPAIAYRMATMREQVRALLLEEIPIALHQGVVGNGRSRDCVTNSTPPRPDRVDHVVARLKRDDPALAERVVRGEVTPNAAAREKGWRKPRIVLSSPERIADSLSRYMPKEALARLVERLVELLTQDDTPE